MSDLPANLQPAIPAGYGFHTTVDGDPIYWTTDEIILGLYPRYTLARDPAIVSDLRRHAHSFTVKGGALWIPENPSPTIMPILGHALWSTFDVIHADLNCYIHKANNKRTSTVIDLIFKTKVGPYGVASFITQPKDIAEPALIRSLIGPGLIYAIDVLKLDVRVALAIYAQEGSPAFDSFHVNDCLQSWLSTEDYFHSCIIKGGVPSQVRTRLVPSSRA